MLPLILIALVLGITTDFVVTKVSKSGFLGTLLGGALTVAILLIFWQ